MEISEDFILRWKIEDIVKDVVSSDGTKLDQRVVDEMSSKILDEISDWNKKQVIHHD